MKKLFILILVMSFFDSFSQNVVEQVSFDNYTRPTDNDLVSNFIFNNFASPNFITQSATGGITGGSLIPPNNVSWGNDVIRYCSTFKNVKDSMLQISVSFKFNSTIINPNVNERSVAIWLTGNVANHNIGFYLNRDMTLSITSYNYAQSTSLTLVNGHWYKLLAQYKSVGGAFNDQVFAKAEIFDLGMNGSDSPVTVGNHTATIYDVDLVSSDKFTIEMSGTKWGGSEYIDNFVFNGLKNSELCVGRTITGFDKINNEKKELSVYPNPSDDGCITIDLNELNIKNDYQLKIINSVGQEIFYDAINQNQIKINISNIVSNCLCFLFITDKAGNMLYKQKIVLQ